MCVHMGASMCMCIELSLSVCMYVCVHVCMYVCVCMCVMLCACMCVWRMHVTYHAYEMFSICINFDYMKLVIWILGNPCMQ